MDLPSLKYIYIYIYIYIMLEEQQIRKVFHKKSAQCLFDRAGRKPMNSKINDTVSLLCYVSTISISLWSLCKTQNT